MFRANKHGGGLTKLRWACSLCQANCIDEHGFAQHLQSQKHLENEQAEDERRARTGPRRFNVDDLSAKFEAAFLDCVTTRHLDQAVLAHDVYHEVYENDRPMTQLKRTCFQSLGQFVTSLRDRGRLEATRTEKGWQVTLSSGALGPDGEVPGEAPRPANVIKKWNEVGALTGDAAAPHRPRDSAEERALALAAAASSEVAAPEARPTALQRDDGAEKLAFGMKRKAGAGGAPAPQRSKQPTTSALPAWPAEEPSTSEDAGNVPGGAWVRAGLVVKVLKSAEPGWRKKRKGVTVHTRVAGEGGVEALVEALDTDVQERVWASLAQLETVIPQVGKAVLICGGAHDGATGTLRKIDEVNFCVSVELGSGEHLKGVPYEDVCKVARS